MIKAMVEAIVAMREGVVVVMNPAARHPDAPGIIAWSPNETNARAGGDIVVIDDRSNGRSDANCECYLGLGCCARCGNDASKCKSTKNAFLHKFHRSPFESVFEHLSKVSELFARLSFLCSPGSL